MHSIFDEFYSTLNLQDLLDDDSIIFTLKEPNQQLIEVLSKNQNLVKEMLDYLHYDEFDTDYRINIKYPFVVSEILSTQYVLEKETIQYLLDQLNSTIIKPAITIGYIGKILLNILKNQPEIFWEIVTIKEIQYLLQDVNNYSIAEVIYSMIIFQTNDNQLLFIEKRIELLNYLIETFVTDNSEGISNILELLLQQISDTIQEQKLIFLKHFLTKISFFTNQLLIKPQEVTKILITLLNNPQINDDDKLQIYRYINYEQITKYLQSDSTVFGQPKMSLILLLEYLSQKEQFQQSINITHLMSMQLRLIQKYPNNNHLHFHATNIILTFIPFFSEEFKNQFELLCTQFLEDPKPNRGFIVNILQRMNRTNNPVVQSLIKVNDSYILDVVPDRQTQFHLEEEFEAAMEKLKIQQE